MYVVEIQLGGELRVGRAGEEIQATVAAEHVARQFNDLRHRRIAEHIIKAGAAGQGAQFGGRICHVRGVDKVQFNAVLGCLLDREQLRSTREALSVDIGHDHERGAHVAVQCIGQCAKAHRACCGEQRELAAFADAHFVLIHAHAGVEAGVERADAAAHRLSEGCFVIRLALVFEQAAQLHDLSRDDAVGRVAAEEFIRVAGRPHGALVVERGLQGELHAGLELVRMLCADLDNIARKLMAHDGRVVGDVLVDTLVLGAEDRALVGRHADAVGHDLDQDLIVFDLGQFEFVQTKVVGCMQTDGFCFHNKTLLLIAQYVDGRDSGR